MIASYRKSGLAVCALVCSTVVLADEISVEATQQGALGDLKMLIEATKSAWAYADDKRENFGVDLDHLSAVTTAQIRKCRSKEEAFEILRKVVAGFKDGHASLRAPDLSSSGPTGRIQGRLRDTREGVVLEKELIVEWKGRSVEEELAPLIERAYASTPGMARQLAIQKLAYGPLKQTVRVRLRDAGGPETERLLRFEEDSETDPPPLELRWAREDIAHLAIHTFDVRRSGWAVKSDGPVNPSGLPALAVEEVQKKISEAFSRCAGAKALILDLRGNGGGTDSIGSHVALHLVAGEFCYFKLQTRFSPELKMMPGFTNSPDSGWSVASDGWKPPRPPAVKPFEGLVWVLLDEQCFSTTDNLLACLRDLLPKERARFLGRPTGGGTGAPRLVARLPFTGAQLTLTVMKVYSPNGKLIEGRGTIPDRAIVWTWSDVVRGRDPDLEAALDEAVAKLGKSSGS